jgi:extradiol dioxygenase family protein
MKKTPFHMSINVTDLNIASQLYNNRLSSTKRQSPKAGSTSTFLPINFFSHQLSLYFGVPSNQVIPVSLQHYSVHASLGVVLSTNAWQFLVDK